MKNLFFRTVTQLAAVLLALVMASDASAAVRPVVQDHSAAHFSIEQKNGPIEGTFSSVRGAVGMEQGKPAFFDIIVDMDTLATGEPQLDKRLKGAELFETDLYPILTFRGSRIEPVDKGYKISGILTIHGIPNETQALVTELDGKDLSQMTFSLDRRDFGMSGDDESRDKGRELGNTLHFTIDLKLQQAE